MHDLNQMLAKRKVPEMRSHLAERIIAAAQEKQSRGVPAWRAWMEAFGDMFVLPQPAVVVAFLLFLGITLGLNTDFFQLSQDASAQDFSSFMQIKDNFDMGEWL